LAAVRCARRGYFSAPVT